MTKKNKTNTRYKLTKTRNILKKPEPEPKTPTYKLPYGEIKQKKKYSRKYKKQEWNLVQKKISNQMKHCTHTHTHTDVCFDILKRNKNKTVTNSVINFEYKSDFLFFGNKSLRNY